MPEKSAASRSKVGSSEVVATLVYSGDLLSIFCGIVRSALLRRRTGLLFLEEEMLLRPEDLLRSAAEVEAAAVSSCVYCTVVVVVVVVDMLLDGLSASRVTRILCRCCRGGKESLKW